jgi:hypothetical protein
MKSNTTLQQALKYHAVQTAHGARLQYEQPRDANVVRDYAHNRAQGQE